MSAASLFPFLQQALAFQPGQTLYPEDAVQLVDLVLQADGGKAVEILRHGASIGHLVAQGDGARARHLFGETRHGDAAFDMGHGFAARLQDLRIDDVAPSAEFGQVEDHEALEDAAMGCGDADTRCGLHRLVERVEPFGESGVEEGDGRARRFEGRVRIAADGKQCHGLGLSKAGAPGRSGWARGGG